MPDFAYLHWRDDYELAEFSAAYVDAERLTQGSRNVDADTLSAVLIEHPTTLRIFRTILGFTVQEFAAATTLSTTHARISTDRVKRIEAGALPTAGQAAACGDVIDRTIQRLLFPARTPELRSKLEKPDTQDGWASVQAFAENGVPYSVFLHQRHYGGAFRQLLDATSTQRGDLLEDAVAALFELHELRYIRTSASNQAEIGRRFGLTVRPAPDFVVYDAADGLRAMLECKGANDGGTARDKAARFGRLRQESQRLGGVPLFAVLAGLGWRRTGDALGPVIQATDGRTFTLATLTEMLTVQPFPALAAAS